MWEKKLRQIEHGEYDAKLFLEEMKQMVSDLVMEVKKEQYKVINIEQDEVKKEAPKAESKTTQKTENTEEITCPKCKQGKIIKGKNAFGCSNYKSGCDFKVEFTQFGKKLTDKQLLTLIAKGKSPKIKGFEIDQHKQNGIVALTSDFKTQFIIDIETKETQVVAPVSHKLVCPKCGKGEMLRGNSAYGCSRFKEGCNFVIPFKVLENQYNTTELTPEILKEI
jgi:DNA topoisomerase-3